jgi:hypothetical protein
VYSFTDFFAIVNTLFVQIIKRLAYGKISFTSVTFGDVHLSVSLYVYT